MNGEEQAGPNLSDFDPSWMQDGYGVIGEQTDPDFSDDTQWDTLARSEDDQQQDFTSAGGGVTVQTGTFGGGVDVSIVNGVTTITFDDTLFALQDNGGGEALISIYTTTC